MAFQPIVNTTSWKIFAYEALVRGINNESAQQILSRISPANRYRFDQACRIRAVQLAARFGIQSSISINFMPNAVYRPENCIQTTLAAAKSYNFPVDRIIFEITENERVVDPAHLKEIIREYKRRGFRTAIDDFGAGYSGLNLLADIQTDLIKLDMALVRGIDQDRTRQTIVKAILRVCQELEIEPIAEGIETYEEFRFLQDLGVELFQGFYFARPAFESFAAMPPPLKCPVFV
ncbi:EAL domain-containing protein [Pseudanabaena sp. FACHB-2040]|uniref:EAL domain-containing protein n=1 Tax=Pseudanabaena sp. FACHB-2040 TaxID=2692859 RepID=UPI0018EFFDD5|nr:EAL domain-containing protein [Pseudanabaena sp. FACHB-2040]